MLRMNLLTLPSPKSVILWGCVIVSGVAFCAAIIDYALTIKEIIGGVDPSDHWDWKNIIISAVLTIILVIFFNLILFSVSALAIASLSQSLTLVGLSRKLVHRMTSLLLIGWLIIYLLVLLVLFAPNTLP